MSRFRYGVALLTAKLSVVALRITRHNGTNFPGHIALKICPNFLKYIAKPHKIVAVTGTNGKTTVSNLVIDSLQSLGLNPLNNRSGSNINSGIATALINGVSIFGKEKYDIAVLEIDERSSKVVFPYVEPDYLIVTNLSRDSIMRNAHPEYIRFVLTKFMPKKTNLILNADDMFSSTVAPENYRVYFGIEKMNDDKTENTNLIDDAQICPVCSSRLKYEYNRYSNIGRVYCPECGFHSPDYDYSAKIEEPDRTSMVIKNKNGESSRFPIFAESIFNIYNEVALVSLLYEMGYSSDDIRKTVSGIKIVKSRYNDTKIKDLDLINMMCKDKNAYATSRVLEYIENDESPKEIMLYNNNYGDSIHWAENMTWLYDCDFELLNSDDNLVQIILYGETALDVRLRLLLAGVPDEKITCVDKPEDGVGKVKFVQNDHVYVLYGSDTEWLGKKILDGVIKSAEKDRAAV